MNETAPEQMWRVARISGVARRVPFALGENRSVSVRALFVDPAGGTHDPSLDTVYVLMCEESYAKECTLYSHNALSGDSTKLLHLPGLDPGSASGYCKSYHLPTATLYLGCYSIHAIKIEQGAATLSGVTNVSRLDALRLRLSQL